jgi:hypothetical protein
LGNSITSWGIDSKGQLMRRARVRVAEFAAGLLSVRTTSFSNRDGICRGGMIDPNSRLHGSSLSGSAAVMVGSDPTKFKSLAGAIGKREMILLKVEASNELSS